ncbi:hypothetical protein CSW12_02405 [Bacillus cereus]|nr:hypothetical protein CSW12_02405 [Bacillus cereus]
MDMEKQKAIDLLNGLEIHDYDADGEELYYALVEINEKVISVLQQLGLTKSAIDFEKDLTDEGDFFDLTKICWKYAGWFNGDHFMLEEPKEVYCESN